MQQWISLREYARRRGVTLGAVQKAIASGRVTAVERNERGFLCGIDEIEANKQWAANTDPVESARNGKSLWPSTPATTEHPVNQSTTESNPQTGNLVFVNPAPEKTAAGATPEADENPANQSVAEHKPQIGRLVFENPDNEEPGPAAAPAAVSADQAEYLAARAKREGFEAKQSELKYLQAIGSLVSANEMRETAFRRYRTLRDKMINIPERVASVIAAERDPARCHKLLTDEIKRVLNELSDTARAEAAGGFAERVET